MQLGTAVFVAVEADAGLGFGYKYRVLGGVNPVAAGAGLFGLLVLAALPMDAGTRLVAG